MSEVLVLKTTADTIVTRGSLFEAVRGHWTLDPERASKCEKVVAIVDQKIRGIYSLDKIYRSTLDETKYVFAGAMDEQLTLKYMGKNLNKDLCIKGAENPVRYTTLDNLIDNETEKLVEIVRNTSKTDSYIVSKYKENELSTSC